MIAPVQSAPKPNWHCTFLAMVECIDNKARFAFRHLDAEAREEAIQEVLVNTFIAYGRLVAEDRAHVAAASALARYAIAQVRIGRYVSCPLNSNDVLSWYAQRRQCFQVQRLDGYSHRPWREVLVEDRRASPAEIALTRIDFEAWVETLAPRQQIVASALAEGYTVTETATKLHVTVGRVSQIRRELAQSWDKFHGEVDDLMCATLANNPAHS